MTAQLDQIGVHSLERCQQVVIAARRPAPCEASRLVRRHAVATIPAPFSAAINFAT